MIRTEQIEQKWNCFQRKNIGEFFLFPWFGGKTSLNITLGLSDRSVIEFNANFIGWLQYFCFYSERKCIKSNRRRRGQGPCINSLGLMELRRKCFGSSRCIESICVCTNREKKMMERFSYLKVMFIWFERVKFVNLICDTRYKCTYMLHC